MSTTLLFSIATAQMSKAFCFVLFQYVFSRG
jgi:hypothetical protein